MTAGMGLKIVVSLIVVNFLFFVVGDIGGDFAGFGYLDDKLTGLTGATIDTSANSTLEMETNNTWGFDETAGQSTTALFVVVDYLAKVWTAVKTFIMFMYAPFFIMSATSLPVVLSYLIGVIWTIMYVVAIMQFIGGRIF